jgi:hypothetical protein
MLIGFGLIGFGGEEAVERVLEKRVFLWAKNFTGEVIQETFGMAGGKRVVIAQIAGMDQVFE